MFPISTVQKRALSSRQAFTLIELLVVVGILTLLVAILLPSLSKARFQAKLAVCASNLHQVGLGINAYACEQKGHIPRGPSPAKPHDFGTSAYSTNQLWFGHNVVFPMPWGMLSQSPSRKHTGLGVLLRSSHKSPEALFCPDDNNFKLSDWVPLIGSDFSSYGSYWYRHLMFLPKGRENGVLGQMGRNTIGGRQLSVRALAYDANSLSPLMPHVNHQSKQVNILVVDGSAARVRNEGEALSFPSDFFDSAERAVQESLRLNAAADYASLTGSPQGAPVP